MSFELCCHSQFQVHGIREWKEAPTGTEVDSVRHLRYTEGFGGKITNMFVRYLKWRNSEPYL